MELNDKQLEKLAKLIANKVVDELEARQETWNEQFAVEFNELNPNAQIEFIQPVKKTELQTYKEDKVYIQSQLDKAVENEDYVEAIKLKNILVDLDEAIDKLSNKNKD